MLVIFHFSGDTNAIRSSSRILHLLDANPRPQHALRLLPGQSVRIRELNGHILSSAVSVYQFLLQSNYLLLHEQEVQTGFLGNFQLLQVKSGLRPKAFQSLNDFISPASAVAVPALIPKQQGLEQGQDYKEMASIKWCRIILIFPGMILLFMLGEPVLLVDLVCN